MEKLGIIDLKKVKPRDYEPFFLKRNPFPAVGVPSDTPLITVDREQIIKRFGNVIAELLSSESSIITVLVGDYGSGKSHLLKVFKQSINSQLLSCENGTLAVYIKSPGENFRDFFLELIEDIGRPLFEKYSEDIVKEYIEKNRTKSVDTIFDPIAKQSFLEGDYNIGELLQKSRHLELFRLITAEYLREVRSTDVAFTFLTLSHPDYSSKAWRWFLGEHLDKKDKEALSVETSIDDDGLAYSTFSSLVALLRVVGIKSLVVVVDELEKITLIHPTKRARYQDQLRRMIDDYPKNLCMYFAIAPRQWDSLTKEPTALVRRLAGNWYVLEEFKMDHTRELIEKYLYFARTDNFSSQKAKAKFSYCEPSLCPFTTESINAIQKVSKGLVSSIILLCRKLLEYLYDNQDKFHSITPGLVELVKQEEGLS